MAVALLGADQLGAVEPFHADFHAFQIDRLDPVAAVAGGELAFVLAGDREFGLERLEDDDLRKRLAEGPAVLRGELGGQRDVPLVGGGKVAEQVELVVADLDPKVFRFRLDLDHRGREVDRQLDVEVGDNPARGIGGDAAGEAFDLQRIDVADVAGRVRGELRLAAGVGQAGEHREAPVLTGRQRLERGDDQAVRQFQFGLQFRRGGGLAAAGKAFAPRGTEVAGLLQPAEGRALGFRGDALAAFGFVEQEAAGLLWRDVTVEAEEIDGGARAPVVLVAVEQRGVVDLERLAGDLPHRPGGNRGAVEVLAAGLQLKDIVGGELWCRSRPEFRDVGFSPEQGAGPGGLDLQPIVLGFFSNQVRTCDGMVEDQFNRAFRSQGLRRDVETGCGGGTVDQEARQQDGNGAHGSGMGLPAQIRDRCRKTCHLS